SNNSERVRIRSSGKVEIGTAGAITPAFITPAFMVVSNNAINQYLVRNGNDGFPAQMVMAKTRGTFTVPTDVQAGDMIGSFDLMAYRGSMQPGASITSTVESVTPGSFGADLRFGTSQPGELLASTKMLINSIGNVGIGTNTPARALHISRGASGATSNGGTRLLVEDDVAAYAQFLTPSTTESGLLFGNETGGIRAGIIFNSVLTDGLDFRTGGNNARMTIDATGQVGIGPNSMADPLTRLEVDGGLTIRRPADVAVVAGANAITVGDRSYLRVSSTGGSSLTTITLSNGLVTGQVLVVECAAVLSNGFQMADSGNLSLSAGHTFNDDDVITLIWNGTDWLELNFVVN
ncbi:MAG TPA: hypothetical protein PK760_09820, partial [Flavobacteriales bacterium]|nr:hypothetical protein [Flavobacteriales bacterium]